ncbi:MAG: sensor histidine kinase, partial [Aquihabitans sp.]
DPALLERSVANVVANALRHGAGEPVEVRASDGVGFLHLRVIDHGLGVPVDQRERLFEPFQRLGDTSGTGVGLGLAVAHGFVTAMGGTITASETPDGGLTMELSLPIADVGRVGGDADDDAANAQGSAP